MKIPKGIKIRDLRIGTGSLAEAGKVAVFHYDCYLPRGEICFTSRDRAHPARIHMGQRDAFPGLEYGILGMAAGGIRSITVSPQLTHQERKRNPDLPANAVLRYEVELLRVDGRWEDGLCPVVPPDGGGPDGRSEHR